MKNPNGNNLNVSAYLYDADGTDKEIELTADVCETLNDKTMLWVDVCERRRETIETIGELLRLKDLPVAKLVNISHRPKLDKYENFYHFFIISVDTSGEATAIDEGIKPRAIDFIVGENLIVTIHDGEVPYFSEFRERERGETQLGEMDTEGFVHTFLDFHIVSYFKAIEKIEHQVDRFDELILRTDMKDKDFLSRMIKLRRVASKLRQWFVPQREVFYALSRPDFKPNPETSHVETFQNLNEHFENAIDAIENARDTVLSLFDLYTTRASHRMNNLMKRLTFITLVIGSMSVIAGVLGMNFEEPFFKSPSGFMAAVAGMGVLALALTATAKLMDWI